MNKREHQRRKLLPQTYQQLSVVEPTKHATDKQGKLGKHVKDGQRHFESLLDKRLTAKKSKDVVPVDILPPETETICSPRRIDSLSCQDE